MHKTRLREKLSSLSESARFAAMLAGAALVYAAIAIHARTGPSP